MATFGLERGLRPDKGTGEITQGLWRQGDIFEATEKGYKTVIREKKH